MLINNLITNNFIVFSIAAIGMGFCLFLFRIFALKTGLVDVPNARKIHSNPVPLVGGLALYLTAVVLFFLTNNYGLFFGCLILVSSLLVIVGMLDDIYQLSALWRFAVQIFASLIIIYFTEVQLLTFGQLLYPNWDLDLGLLAIPITVFGVVGVINALNMADGIDGLAAMTFFVPALMFMGLINDDSLSLWLLSLLAAILVFLIFNKSSQYKVFLGDSGSLFLGFILAWFLVYFSQGELAIINPVTALFFVALPVYDTIFVMVRRILKKKSPFKPDNTHLHHLFLAHGWSQSKVLVGIVLLQIMLVVLGVIFLKIQLAESIQFYIFVTLSATYYYILKKLWERKTWNI
ncbi:MAG: MraY family glycosyltransferase [Marinicellaceae bacterium]